MSVDDPDPAEPVTARDRIGAAGLFVGALILLLLLVVGVALAAYLGLLIRVFNLAS